MKLAVLVKPGSSRQQVIENPDGSLTVYLRAKPHDGEANAELLKLLSKHFDVPKTSLALLSGAKSRHKIFHIPV